MIPFTRDELRVVLGTSGVYALRMIGLYMALPLMATWAAGLPGATPFLVGIALGAYGLTQAIFQVPFGILGDVRGRRLVIVVSLLVFALGSAVVAWAGSIFAVIAGRLIQGVGAMASTLIALIGDHTRDDVRTRGMALLGLVLGVAFAAGFLLGPLVSSKAGVPAVFGAAAVLSVLGVVMFELLVPSRLVPHIVRGHRARPGTPGAWSWAEAGSLFHDRSLLVLDAGIFVLHASVTGLFVVVPFILKDRGIADLSLWTIYAPALAAGLVSLLLSSRIADRASRRRAVLAVASIAMILGLAGLAAFHRDIRLTVVFLAVFVAGFGAHVPRRARHRRRRVQHGAVLGRVHRRCRVGTAAAARPGRAPDRAGGGDRGVGDLAAPAARPRDPGRDDARCPRTRRGDVGRGASRARLAACGARGRLDGRRAGARAPLARRRAPRRARGAGDRQRPGGAHRDIVNPRED